jgi:hypothetical protein
VAVLEVGRRIGVEMEVIRHIAKAGLSSLEVYKAIHAAFPKAPVPREIPVFRRGLVSHKSLTGRVAMLALEFDERHPGVRVVEYDHGTPETAVEPTPLPELAIPEFEPVPASMDRVALAAAYDPTLDRGRIATVVRNLREGYQVEAIWRHYVWADRDEFERYLDAAYVAVPALRPNSTELDLQKQARLDSMAVEALLQLIAVVVGERDAARAMISDQAEAEGRWHERERLLQAEIDRLRDDKKTLEALLVEAETQRDALTRSGRVIPKPPFIDREVVGHLGQRAQSLHVDLQEVLDELPKT